MCQKFVGFVHVRYPQLNQIKYKVAHHGRNIVLRARYRRRAIHAEGMDFEKTMSCFYRYLVIKLSLEQYYPSRLEMKEKKQLEPFLVKLGAVRIHPNEDLKN
jgi:hypothetical protein